MRKIFSPILLLVSLSFGLQAHAAVSEKTQECIDRLNGHILKDFPNLVSTDETLNQYRQQGITNFCLKYNPKTSTQSNSDYSELMSTGKNQWDLLEIFAGRVIFYESDIAIHINAYAPLSSEAVKDIQNRISLFTGYLTDTKDKYQKPLADEVAYWKGQGVDTTTSFAGYVSYFIDQQFNDFYSFTSTISNAFPKNYSCDPYSSGKCLCFEQYEWAKSGKECLLKTVSSTPSPSPTPTSSSVSSPLPIFTDVTARTPYADSITKLAERKIINGYPSGAFLPNKTLNRAELLKIVIGAKYGGVDDKEVAGCFSDVDASQWYAKYVCFAKTKGIVKGYPDGTFLPGQEITFAEATKIALAAWGKVFDTIPWYQGYVDYLNTNAVDFSGTPTEEKLSRGKMAHLIWNVIDHLK